MQLGKRARPARTCVFGVRRHAAARSAAISRRVRFAERYELLADRSSYPERKDQRVARIREPAAARAPRDRRIYL
eukprot:2753245-Pyramimonas_sp.AAC.1